MVDRRRSRRLAAGLGAAALMFGVAACGGGSSGANSGDPNTLEVWTRSNPDPAETYKRVFAAFTKKTGIKVDYQPVVNFDQQLQARASTKDLPDVMINDTALMGSYQSQGLLKRIDPATIAGGGQIDAKTWATTVGLDGGHYGVPYSRQAFTLFIRKDWREKLGLPVPRTWAEMLTLAKAFADKDPDGDGKKDTYGMVVPGSAQNGYVAWWGASYLWQSGARIIEPTKAGGYRPVMDSDAAVNAVTWLKKNLFCTEDNAVIQPGAITAMTSNATNFQDGNAGMYLTGPYNIATFDTVLGKDKFEVVQAPAGPAGNNDVLADGENVYFGAETGKDKQEQALAAFLVSPEGQKLAMTGDHQPVVRIPVNSMLNAATVHDDPRWGVVQKAYEDASVQFPNALDWAPFRQDTADALNSIFTYCGGNVRSGLKELNDTLAGDLKDQDLLK
ncbi:ABC transporter substrate-binding protein [Streptomyces acidiscabies]|uniref:Sugar ABC transporter substrate-binding protein n=1 Tax=Streptomyces acidiscabies TaxID=42234 RepID=A0AAP6EDS3_9ACTN|nr:sugar ABC transporter substrate-binding protein [Streptomyces acidiscabies]MBZ3912990.1 sugar ABC transporter substrate-binding protein [Streptomyces acidiscabies]MDX2958475.1 sugar ABC transporter substrate-binding protein [Streptomyces acidiscabies]MDX3021019.1 sugar ABC transporter substrate-binding protein [Streptomyces acidiscabies]MDX3794978.1 sugar ABC transporter substrate-binding protein [Streptomyces acidiscabies]GAQ53537.1 lipoprotein LipO precursor [Streptomyces acidiscabies]